MARRSVLFSPGDRPELMRKGPATNADVLCFDLEDAVAPGRKAAAREAIRELLSDPTFDPAAEVCVRLTLTDPIADLDALVGGTEAGRSGVAGADAGSGDADGVHGPRLDAVMLPKVESADRIDRVAALCRERGLDGVDVIALVETAGGVLSAPAIARAAATDALAFGAEDLAADLGATRTDEGTEVLCARQRVVLAASAADVDAIDTVYTDFSDEVGLREETRFAVTLGYDGKLAIHPSQVDPIHEAFTPTPDRIEWATSVLTARKEADAAERGVFEVDGEMIDPPLLVRAERIVERAAAAGLVDPDRPREEP